MPIAIYNKSLEDSNLNESEKEWLNLINFRRLRFLTVVMIGFIIYILMNLYWNYIMYQIMEESKDIKQWEVDKRKKGYAMSLFNRNISEEGKQGNQTRKKFHRLSQIPVQHQTPNNRINSSEREIKQPRMSFFTAYNKPQKKISNKTHLL